MKLSKYLFLLCFLSISALFAQPVNDIIEPVRLVAGRTDSVLLSDVFYSKNYNLTLNKNKYIAAKIEDNYLKLKADKNFEGLTLLNFVMAKKPYIIPVFVNKLQLQKFSYKPSGNPQKVNLFGSFNSWNRENLPMVKNPKTGVYEIETEIEPGRYEYKFFVDGKEVVDPANPDKVSNGMGDYNSIVNVSSRFDTKVYLHQIEFKEEVSFVEVKFYYEKEKQSKKLTINNVSLIFDNHPVNASNIKIDGNYFTVSIDKKVLKEKNLLRAVVCQDGQPTNIQTVFFENGKPAGTASNDWHNSIIYSLMVDRFCDGDKTNDLPVVHPDIKPQANYNGGDIQGLINKLKDGYFDSLHINTIWITPVVDNPNEAYQEFPEPHRWFSGYHGYWPIDTTRIEEKFGTLELFKEFTSLAHKHNIKVLLDFVAHHVHIQHPYWKAHRDWFGSLELPDGRKNLRLWDEQRLTTWFEPYMPSFDYSKSKEAVEAMTDNALWWLNETGIDGFRHDAVKHVHNLFWRRLTEKIKTNIEIPQHKKVYQIGETFGSFDLIKSYVNNGQLDAQFNFNLYDAAFPVFADTTIPFSVLNNQLQKSFTVYGANNLMGNIMDSHDKNRFMAYADGALDGDVNPTELGWSNPPVVKKASSYNKLKNYLTYLLTIPGLPVIYYGDEFGMTGASDPDNRRMMRFGDSLTVIEKQTLADVQKLVNIRRSHSALNFGDFQTITADKNVFAYIRSDFNERILVIINKSFNNLSVPVSVPEFYKVKDAQNLLTGEKTELNKNSITIPVEGLSFKIFKLLD